ncbi:MAG TPA: PIN domain nuclease, partial [Anaerolineales bacterium]|nr:PIN domain nuclease [Anaerolineales bacterium]
MSSDFIARIIGLLVLMPSGVLLGITFGEEVPNAPLDTLFYAVVFGLLGGLIGLVLTPYV